MPTKTGKSSAPRSSREVPGARRRQILTAAASLFAKHGFHGVSVDDIGAAVGISGPALYHHFSGKDAVVLELLNEVAVVLLSEGERRVAAAANPQDALAELIEWHADYALSNPDRIVVYVRDLPHVPAADQRPVRRLRRSYFELWVDTISKALNISDRSRIESPLYAVFGMLNRASHTFPSRGKEEVELLQRMSLAALYGAFEMHPAGEGPMDI